MNFQPVIKWSGSKRPLSQQIVDLFPREINNYYEPFCGGASVMRCLLDNIEEGNIKVNGNIICSDINNDLINLWRDIKDKPRILCNKYKELWETLNSRYNEQSKKEYFEFVRDRLNKEHKTWDFLFINRTCFNGLIRYNSKGEFNTSFHLNRKGIIPEKLEKIIFEWSELLRKYNVYFTNRSYEYTLSINNDLIYLDPPYSNINSTMYFGNFNHTELFDFLKKAECKWLLSYDGKSGEIDKTFDVPKELYKEHLYLKSGNSSFKRIKETSKDSIVYESLYKNY